MSSDRSAILKDLVVILIVVVFPVMTMFGTCGMLLTGSVSSGDEEPMVSEREEAIDEGWFGPVDPDLTERWGHVLVAMRTDRRCRTVHRNNQ